MVATDMGRVWARIKQTAQEYSDKGVFPGFEGAEMIVLAIMRDEGMRSPPQAVLELLACECVKLISEYDVQERLRKNAS